MEINTESYNVWYDATNQTIFLKGSLRLSGTEEYKSIVELLNSVVDREPSTITLNLEKLEFLNSSGINMLSKFVINVRKKKAIQMIVIGSRAIPWQGKSLKNLQRLMPSLKLKLVDRS